MKPTDAKVLIVGAGGLGSPAAIALARAGVSSIGFVDDDRVDASNLHRQILHRTADRGRPKAESACDAVGRIAPSIAARAITTRLDATNVIELIRDFDVVLDGSDNFATKFLINDACVLARLPFVHAGAVRWSGQLLAVRPGAPCYRCLFEEQPPPEAGVSCREAGVVGPVVGVIGSLQAEAAIRLLENEIEIENVSELVVYDGLKGTFRTVRFNKNPACRACGEQPISTIDPNIYEVAAC